MREGKGRVRTVLTEVQALRAVAVLSVVVYHVAPRWLPGGYVGVDVFFVISGFLITRHLLKEVDRSGHISLPRFWANRARRILPASLVVILASTAAAWFFVPLDDIPRTSNQAIAATWYVENWTLAAESVDYLASANQPTMFQHFWSLSVEEQFYLGWPLILTVVAAIAMAVQRGSSSAGVLRGWLTGAMAVVVLASLSYSIWLVVGGEASAYFNSLGRLWELAAGGLLAGFYRDPTEHRQLRAVLSTLGFVLIALACLTFTKDTAFPGAAALLPVAGAALVISAGRSTSPVSLTPLLEWSPVQKIGDWSYSIYLWHFGLVVLASYHWNADRLPWWVKVSIVVATIGISALSYRFIEQPFRRPFWAQARLRRIFTLALAGLLVATAAGIGLGQRVTWTANLWSHQADQIQQRAFSYRVDPNETSPVAAFPDAVALLYPSPLTVTTDQPTEGVLVDPAPGVASNQCQSPILATTTVTCVAGTPDSPIRVALVGDSHARVMLSPFDEIGRQKKWRIETHLHASCPFSTTERTSEALGKIRCQAANQAVLRDLLDNPPDLVVVTSWSQVEWAGVEQKPEIGVQGYQEMIEPLRRAGIAVAVIRDTASPRDDVVRCMVTHYGSPKSCQQSAAAALRQHDELVTAAERVPGTAVVDLDRYLCGAANCPAVINHIMVYRDGHHLSRTYALALTPAILAQLPIPART